MEKRGRGFGDSLWGMQKRCRLAYFAPTHTCAQDRACAPLYAWRPGLHAALRVGTGAEERLSAGILGAGRPGSEGGVGGRVGGPGRGRSGRVGGGVASRVGVGQVGCWRAGWEGGGKNVHTARKGFCYTVCMAK